MFIYLYLYIYVYVYGNCYLLHIPLNEFDCGKAISIGQVQKCDTSLYITLYNYIYIFLTSFFLYSLIGLRQTF